MLEAASRNRDATAQGKTVPAQKNLLCKQSNYPTVGWGRGTHRVNTYGLAAS